MNQKKQHATVQETSQAQVPQTFAEAFFIELDKLGRLKSVATILAIIVFLSYLLWVSVPEDQRKETLEKLGLFRSDPHLTETAPPLDLTDLVTRTTPPMLHTDGQPISVDPSVPQYNLLQELRTKGLLDKLIEAGERFHLGGPNVEPALQGFRRVVEQLSPEGRSRLNQALLSEANSAYKARHNSDAVRGYLALFDPYLPKGVRE